MAKRLTFNKGDIIFKESEFTSSFFNICFGSVGLYVNYKQKGQTLIEVLNANDLFGESDYFASKSHLFTAIALEKTIVDEIDKESLSDYFKTKQHKIYSMMEKMGSKLDRTYNSYVKLKTEEKSTSVEKEDKGLFKRFF